RQVNGPLRPLISGNVFSSGTKTSSKTNSPVSEARSDILYFVLGALYPSISFSTRKPRMTPSSSLFSLALAQTTARSAIGELVIHILAPLRIQPPSVLEAVVVIPPGSEP